MKYRWVERSEELVPFGDDFNNAEDAKNWGRDFKAQGNMTPEHNEIFLITIDGEKMDLYKENGIVVNLGSV